MPNEQITSYINQSRQAGLSDEQIQQNLLKAGWSSEIVQIELSSSVGGEPGPKSKNHGTVIVLLLCALLVGAFGINCQGVLLDDVGESLNVYYLTDIIFWGIIIFAGYAMAYLFVWWIPISIRATRGKEPKYTNFGFKKITIILTIVYLIVVMVGLSVFNQGVKVLVIDERPGQNSLHL